jgi:hypothetical protein
MNTVGDHHLSHCPKRWYTPAAGSNRGRRTHIRDARIGAYVKTLPVVFFAVFALSLNEVRAQQGGLQTLTPAQAAALSAAGIPPTEGAVTLANRLELGESFVPHALAVDGDLSFVLKFRGAGAHAILVYDGAAQVADIPCPGPCLNMNLERSGRLVVQDAPPPPFAAPVFWNLDYSGSGGGFTHAWSLLYDLNAIIPPGSTFFSAQAAAFTWEGRRYLAFTEVITGYLWVFDPEAGTASPRLTRPEFGASPQALPPIVTTSDVTIPLPPPNPPIVIPAGSSFMGVFLQQLASDRQSVETVQFTPRMIALPGGMFASLLGGTHGLVNVKDSYLAFTVLQLSGGYGIRISELMGSVPSSQKEYFEILPGVPGLTDWVAEVVYRDGKLFWIRSMSASNLPGDIGLQFPLFMTNAPENPNVGFQRWFVAASLDFDFPSALNVVRLPGTPEGCTSVYVNPTSAQRLAEVNYSLPPGQDALLEDTRLPVVTWCDD